MDINTYRLDHLEKQAEAADARMGRIEDRLSAIQVTLAGLATKDSVLATKDSVLATKDTIRNWGIGLIAIVIATGLGVGAMVLQSSANQLAAFQSGLNAIQAVSAAHDILAARPAKP